MKENRTVCEVENKTDQASKRVVFRERTTEKTTYRFPLTSNELLEETLKQADNKNTNISAAAWIRNWSSLAYSRNINASIEIMPPPHPMQLETKSLKYYTWK